MSSWYCEERALAFLNETHILASEHSRTARITRENMLVLRLKLQTQRDELDRQGRTLSEPLFGLRDPFKS